MNDYYELRFELEGCTEDMTDLLAALLADEGFESFVPDATGLTAYVAAKDYDAACIDRVLQSWPYAAPTSVFDTLVPGRDWNETWEKNYFQPIVIGDRCVIHSSFHTDVPQCEYSITIDPKMSFGTGHHHTTSQIVQALLSLDINGKRVIDMGTGTGILAILSAMRGASSVTAIEIDPFAYENAVENVSLNHHPEIEVLNGDAALLANTAPADIFIANINRNVIIGDMPRYASALNNGGVMILSGFYTQDVELVAQCAAEYGLKLQSQTEQNNWACPIFIKA